MNKNSNHRIPLQGNSLITGNGDRIDSINIKTQGGAEIINAQTALLPSSPGVYRMMDAQGTVLYVGKAKNLRKRVQNYTKLERQTKRIACMIALTRSLECVTTESESKALLLEANLIKRLKPRFNIVLRDDKSFPSIFIDREHPAPPLLKHRGKRSRKGDYFGPFASARDVDYALKSLQKAFLLRSCPDSVYSNRSRPCLLYQIKRCSAPCTGEISLENYNRLVSEASDFLAGRSQNIRDHLVNLMQQASASLDFEQAALYRDRLSALNRIQSEQKNLANLREADVFAIYQEAGQSCIQVFFFRNGQNLGNKPYFLRNEEDISSQEILSSFLPQFYDEQPPPTLILLSTEIPDLKLLAEALRLRSGHPVEIAIPSRGRKLELVLQSFENARNALQRKLAGIQTQQHLIQKLAETFNMSEPPRRIEVYDNSHTQGSYPVGCMIVSGPEGFIKNQYRKFNIKSFPTGTSDDYAMMQEVLRRRFSHLQRQTVSLNSFKAQKSHLPLPDFILIDGGQGHLVCAYEILQSVGLEHITLVAMAKGVDRNGGKEHFFVVNREPFVLQSDSPLLYFLQRLRDEAHRFAVGSHRIRRSSDVGRSPLDDIVGIGKGRKSLLLRHFGSAKAVSEASVAELLAVKGIGSAVGQLIYAHFHPKEI